MSLKVEYTPYDSVITVGELALSLSSKGKDFPAVAVKSSKCDYATLNVPLSLFQDLHKKNSFVLEDLYEQTTVEKQGVNWLVTQKWEGGNYCTTTIPHSDMYKLQQHIKEVFRVRKVLGKKYKTKRILKRLILPFCK